MKYLLGVFLCLLLIFGVILRAPTFPSDVTQFLPVDSASAMAAKELANSGLSQRVIILVDGPQREEVTEKMKGLLEASDLFSTVKTGPPKNPVSIHKLYFPRRYDFARATRVDLEKLDTPLGMKGAAEDFIESMSGRYASMMRRLGPDDPFLSYVGVLERLQSLRPELKVRHGKFETATKESILFAEIKKSPFDANNAKAVDAAIRNSFSSSSTETSGYTVSGVYRHTLKISSSIKRDIQRISVIGLVGLIFIFGLVFGRFRIMILPLASISVGGGFAFAITSLVFGEIHLIAVAIGASLIGVCVDYSIHFLNHPASSSSVWPAIRVGALTTTGGFGILFISSVSALHQIALFASSGVLASVLTTWFITRNYFQGPPTKRHLSAIRFIDSILQKVRGPKGEHQNGGFLWGALFTVPIVIIIIAGLPSARLERDLQSLRTPLPEIQRDDATVREKVSGARGTSIILVRAKNSELALQRNDALALVLKSAEKDGVIEKFSSLNNVLWSEKNQKENRDFFEKHQDSLKRRLTTQFEKVGVQTQMLSAFEKGFPHEDSFLSLEDLRESDLVDLVKVFDPNGEGRIILTYLGEVKNETELETRIASVEGAFWFRKTKTLNQAWHHLGMEIFRAIGFGLLLIALIAFVSFRDLWSVIATLGPPILGCFATLGMLSLIGISIGPIHGLALILVIAIAADYGVMLVAHQEHFSTLALSILMAYASTMFSFGALALSSNPVLHAFGLTIASGVTFALFLLPGFDWALTRFKK